MKKLVNKGITDADLIIEVRKLDALQKQKQPCETQRKKIVNLLKLYNGNLSREYHMSISKTRHLIQQTKLTGE